MNAHDLRRSERLTVTLPFAVVRAIEVRAADEGRSVSNMAAFLLEQSFDDKSRPG
jgi:hypothetical protein